MKTVLLNSGGLDSLATAIMMTTQGHELHSLYIDLGYLNREVAMPASQLIANTYCVDHHVITVDGLLKGRYEGFPYQQFLFHTLAAAYANNLSLDYIVSGNKGEMLKDDFEEQLVNIFKCTKPLTPKIPIRPLKNMTNFDQIYAIIKDSPILKSTVSCAQPTVCGVCVKCKQRQKYSIDSTC